MDDMDVHEITDRVGERFDDLRDKVAGGISAEHAPAYRELARNRRALDRLTDTLDERFDSLEAKSDVNYEKLRAYIDGGGSWLGRIFWMLVGAGIGAAVAHLMDPDRGTARRAQLSDQLGSKARDLGSTAKDKATYAAGAAQGSIVDAAKERFDDGTDADVDPHTLRQRIQSEVVGHVDGATDVVVTVHADGLVSLKGKVTTKAAETELVERTREVKGVTDVKAELTIG